jgi:hypothetical protein
VRKHAGPVGKSYRGGLTMKKVAHAKRICKKDAVRREFRTLARRLSDDAVTAMLPGLRNLAADAVRKGRGATRGRLWAKPGPDFVAGKYRSVRVKEGLDMARRDLRRTLDLVRRRVAAAEAMVDASEGDELFWTADKLYAALELLKELREARVTSMDCPPVVSALREVRDRWANAETEAECQRWDIDMPGSTRVASLMAKLRS